MVTTQKIQGCLLVALFSLVFIFKPTFSEQSQPSDYFVTIVHFNDIHGSLSETETSIGYSKIAGFIEDLRSKNPNTLVLDAGDVIAGSPNAALDQGIGFSSILNTIGIDVMTAGNAEFSYGSGVLKKFRDKINYPLLVPNMVEKVTREPLSIGNTVITLQNGLKVGVFGVTTPDSGGMGTTDYEYVDAIESAKEQVSFLKSIKVDLIIGLVHLGETNLEANVLDIANNVPGVDLIIDGHTHTSYPLGIEENGVLISQTGAYENNIGVIDLKIINNKIQSQSARLYTHKEISQFLEKPLTKRAVEEYEALLKDFFEVFIGSSLVELEGARNTLRTQETNLGNMITDAIRYKSEADLVLYPAGNIAEIVNFNEISRRDIYTMARLNVDIVVHEMSGAQILEFITHSSQLYPEPSGYFLQISGGSYEILTTSNPVEIGNIVISNTPLELDKLYSVAVEIGATVLPGVNGTVRLKELGYIAPIIEEYILKNSPVSPVIDGRIFID